jgi:hypothetical protein
MPTLTASIITNAVPPQPVHVVVDGDDCYEVPLMGRGEGQTFVIDATVWDDLQARGFPSAWTITGGGLGYVSSAAKSVRASDAELLPGTPRYLSRVITNVQEGQAVTYRNGNRRDLRLQNLVVSPRGDVLGWPSKRGWRKSKRAN